ncbi:LUD domain-containing protein [Verrucomicrobiaceae bacterium N1E253]|uniref:LUD domain-containing protein n=1 Tax=Oceaniferula marina TaxID=2748318 RepID=A0A851GGW4_9BACT|nr:LUD domain-containing protein [Oceaniferula marina]NWK54495.1 LUD domain-containing protein [Oceaniferula marina]
MSRDAIFSNIKNAIAKHSPTTPLPDYDPAIVHSPPKLEGEDLWQIFSRNFSAVNGKPMQSVDELIALLKEQNQSHGYCDPSLMDSIGSKLVEAGLNVETEYDRSRYDDYAFGITRATGAIAESGTLILNDEQTSDRLAALSPWVHVGVMKRSEILRTIPDAIASFGNSPNIIWATGPSKTADVEGILIEGVHGPGEEIALMLD